MINYKVKKYLDKDIKRYKNILFEQNDTNRMNDTCYMIHLFYWISP